MQTSGTRRIDANGGCRAEHTCHRSERAFDLAELDAETTNLHLIVSTTKEVQNPSPASDQIAGAVEACPRQRRIGDEPSDGQIGAVQVSADHLRTAQIQLARNAFRNLTQVVVEDSHVHISPGLTDRDSVAGRDDRRCRPHRGLGGSIDIPDRSSVGHQIVGQILREGFPSHQGSHHGESDCVLVFGDHSPQRRRCLHHCRIACNDQRRQRIRVANRPAVCDHDSRARRERAQQLECRDVERHRCHRDDAIARPDPAILEYRVREGCEVARRDHHALGATRRTGGVDHVGEVITRRGRRRKHDTRVGELTVHEDTRGDRGRKLPGAVDTGQDTHRSRVVDHELEPLSRVIDVEWQVRSADAQYREQSGHQIRISIQRDGDYLLGSGADREKFAGQLVDARRQFPVGNSDLAGDHRDVVGVAADVSSEQRRDPRRRRRASARVAIRLVFRQSQIRDDSADFVTEDRDHTVEQCVRSRGVEQPGINRQSKFCCGSDEFEVDALSGRVTDTGSEQAARRTPE